MVLRITSKYNLDWENDNLYEFYKVNDQKLQSKKRNNL